MSDSDGWERAYRRRPSAGYGRDSRDAAMPRLVRRFRQAGVQRVLDLGCGDGRHLVFLARQGFEVCGLDYAPTALRLARRWLLDEGLQAQLKNARMDDIPWPDDHFGAVLAARVINHNRLSAARATVHEVFRVLRPGGLLFATLPPWPPPDDWWERRAAEVEPRTYVPAKGHDRGVAHHFFTEQELRDLLDWFQIVELEADRSWRLLARKPARQEPV